MENEDFLKFEYWFAEPLVVIGEAYRRKMNMPIEKINNNELRGTEVVIVCFQINLKK